MDYIQLNLEISPSQPWKEIITQELASIGFESFMEENEILQAFIKAEDFNEVTINTLLDTYRQKNISIHSEKILIPFQNWNATWEENYEPILIGKDLQIRAPFHEENPTFKIRLEIQPKMSFGTGHHQTTYLLCQTMLSLDFSEKKVLDVGTGTGVLGILASKLGATSILGTDIEAIAVENTIENCERNGITNFTVKKGDIEIVPNTLFDVILANINKNVLLGHLATYSKLLADDGWILLSGFFETDVDDLTRAAKKYNLEFDKLYTKEGWAVLKLIKNR